jgi:hypothetical protein
MIDMDIGVDSAGQWPDVLARNISSELTSAKRFPPLSSRAAS